MSVTPEMIDAMIAAGLTREQMATLMKASLAQAEAEKAEKRAKAAAKKRRQRAGVTAVTSPSGNTECPPLSPGHEGTNGDTGGQVGTARDNPAAPLHGPLAPPAPPHSPLNPPTTPLSEPDGSAAGAATVVDHRRDLFGRGLAELRRMTGKADPQCRTLTGKWLREAQDSAVIVLAAIDEAAANDVINPVPFIEAIVRREAQRNGSGSSDLFVGRASGGRRAPAGNSAVTSALARHANRSGIGPGLRTDGARPGDEGHRGSGRDDSAVEDADWTPASGYRAAH